MFGRSNTQDIGRGREGSQMYALRSGFNLGQKLPDLFTRKAGDGREQSHQCLTNAPGRSLRRAAGLRLGRGNVEPVFEHVEVECAQVHDAEMIYPVIDLMESKLVVPLSDVVSERARLTQHVLIERFHLVERHRISLRIEIIKITQDVAERVPDLLVVFSDALHQGFGADYVFTKVDGRRPQANDFSAQAIGDIDRIDIIATRL